jgi:capsular polysaccharide biosynthesis protein
MNSQKNNYSNDYIDLTEILRKIWAYKFVILVLTLVGMILSSVAVEFFTKDTYTASGILYVSNKKEDEDSEVSKNDIDTSKLMSSTYIEILQTCSFLTDVSKDLDERFSWGQIKGMISLSTVNETQLIRISTMANSAEDAYLVADSIVRQAPKKLSSVFKNGEIEVVDNVVMPKNPQSKNLPKKAAEGAVVGFAIGIVLAVVMSFFDTKIHKSEDVARRYNISVLGSIAQ